MSFDYIQSSFMFVNIKLLKMSLCRTCLSKNDLKPIFSDNNNVILRSEQLYLVSGIKIELNDGLPQLICISCTNLVNSALKFRQQSSIAEETLKNTITTIKIETDQSCKYSNDKNPTQIIKNNRKSIDSKEVATKKSKIKKLTDRKKFSAKKFEQANDYKYSVFIQDFESSNDSDFINNLSVDEENLQSDDESQKACIEDYESADSCDFNFSLTHPDVKVHWDVKEKELLKKEERKLINKEQDEKLLSLAVTPNDSRGPIKCSLCSKVLRNLQNFKCHAKTHFAPQHACEECGKKFVTPSHMRYHQQRVHGRRKRLACSTCSYRAVDPLQLQNHERAEHTGERPYVCDVCGDSFRMRANIAQHMRKHFGVRNLQCDRCPSMFRSRSELTGHQNRVHYLSYTYLCYLCTETYKRPASVKKHLLNVHGVPRPQQLPIKCIKTSKRSSENSE
ncbi:zinc finger protein 37-like [Trichoplusia ni]|uniref:Zinc finger protein 37-like n=1 Tax=Trichoplusia ni TaxID=7111 RepID=A0A7E5X1X1_TRINI|nr:zinc finger protein 37-like [Trichoplusia ni]